MANEIIDSIFPDGADMTYGGGYGYLPYLNDRDKLLASLYLGQGGLGESLLDTLTKLRMDPAAGPLGLAATSAYGGGAQARAQATNGAGIESPYVDDFDRLLKGLMQGIMTPGSQFNPANGGQINTANTVFKDPNKAPSMTPAAAAQTPDQAQQWIDAWQAFNPGKVYGQDQGGVQYPVPGAKMGAKIVTEGETSSVAGPKDGIVTPHPFDHVAEKAKKFQKVTKSIQDLIHHDDAVPGFEGGGTYTPTPTPTPSAPQPAPHSTAPARIQGPTFEGDAGVDPYAAYGGRDLVNALNSYVAGGGSAQRFISTMHNLQVLGQMLQQGTATVAGRPPIPGTPNPSLTSLTPDLITQLLEQYSSKLPEHFAGGGGMTIGGQPHFIVDAQGNKVAALTEDNKPEHVGGFGGVEVTPMDPARRALYERRKQFGSVIANAEAAMQAQKGRGLPANSVPAGMGARDPGSAISAAPTGSTWGPAAPDLRGVALGQYGPQPIRAATGASVLFPQVADAPSTNDYGLPTTRGEQVGDYFKSSYDPSTGSFSLPSGANDIQRYAKLLGGALSSSNSAISADKIRALNMGLAPNELMSAQELGTLSPSQQKGYLALLQQMGLGSVEDNLDQINKFRPAAANFLGGGVLSYAKGGSHFIQKAIKHPGALHKSLGVPEGKKIPTSKIEAATHSANKKLAARARFAQVLAGMRR